MQIVDARQAVRNRQSNRPFSIWSTPSDDLSLNHEICEPDNAGARVYTDFCKIKISPSFRFDKSMGIFSSGSCFAREIELALYERNMRVLSWSPDTGLPNEAFHRYNTQTILSEFNYALNENYDEENVQRVGGGWADFTGYATIFPTREEALKQRLAVIAQHRRALEADLVVLTLGLVEAWYDKRTNRYMNSAPYPLFHSRRDDLELRITDYAENMSALKEFEQALHQHNPAAKILVTVSPVPFSDTFSGEDAVIANTYSKSVLRAVAHDWARSSERVDYFPSYEMVTLSSPASAWLADHRHVKRLHVEKIVQTFLDSYVGADETVESLA